MLFLRTFGGLSLENGSQALSGAAAQRRPLAVLAVIAAAGERGVPRETLQTLFWPDSDAERARGSLKQLLYAFRRDVKEEAITLGTSELRLNPSVIGSDLAEFKAAIAKKDFELAVSLHRGRFLDGLQLKDLDEFSRWLDRERQFLSQEYRSALEVLAKAAANSGDHEAAARWLGKLAVDDPYASRIALAYMRQLEAANEREAAIRHGVTYSQLVKQELEAEPDKEISTYIAALRALPRSSSRADVTRVAVRPTAEANADETARDALIATPQPPASRARWFAALAVAVVATGLITFTAVRGRVAAASSASATSRLVVVPFENRTGDPAYDALGSMGADWITDGLARIELIPVADPATAASAVMQLSRKSLKDSDALREIAKVTGATRLVSGSFYRRGDSLEFHARVSDGETGKILGAIEPVVVPVSKAESGVQTLRQHTLSLLAHLIDARLSQVVMPETKLPAFAAYREFVKGVDLMSRRSLAETDWGDTTAVVARSYFRRAHALDTTFVTALVWALHSYTIDGWTDEGKRVLDSVALRQDRLTPLDRQAVNYFRANVAGDKTGMMTAAKAASEIAPRSEWSWLAGQMVFPLNRPKEALKYFSRLDPDHGWMQQGWEYYWYLTAQAKHMTGDLPATQLWLRRARVKFPENAIIAAAYARGLALTGRQDSVAPIVSEILQSDVEWKMFYVYSILEDLRRHGRHTDVAALYRQVAPWYRSKGKTAIEPERREYGRILFSLNANDSANVQFTALLKDFPRGTWRTFYTGHLAVLAAMRGDTAAVRRLMTSVPREIQQWAGENSYWRARVAAQLGKKEEAVGLLQAAFAEGYPQVSLSHSTWHDFPPLQGYPSFETLVASDR